MGSRDNLSMKKVIPVHPHGGKFREDNATSVPVKDLPFEELDYYRDGRDEPVPPDANICSAVKARSKHTHMLRVHVQSEEERIATERRNFEALVARNATKSTVREIPIPAYDPMTWITKSTSELQAQAIVASASRPQSSLGPERVAPAPKPDNRNGTLLYSSTAGPESFSGGTGGRSLSAPQAPERLEQVRTLNYFFDRYLEGRAVQGKFNCKLVGCFNQFQYGLLVKDENLAREVDIMTEKMNEYFKGDKRNAQARRMELIPGYYYVHRAETKAGIGKYFRCQFLLLTDPGKARLFIVDKGIVIEADGTKDLYPMLEEWAQVPAMGCIGQDPGGPNYLNNYYDGDYAALHEKQWFEVTPLRGKIVTYRLKHYNACNMVAYEVHKEEIKG